MKQSTRETSINLATTGTIQRTPKVLSFPKPPAQLKFSQSWLDKRKLKARDLKVYPIDNNNLAPEINQGNFVMVDSANTSIVSGKFHAFVYDSEFYIKRLDKLPNGDLMAITNNDKQLIKNSKAILFIPLGLVVHRQGEL